MRTESPEKLARENKAVRAYMVDVLIMLTAVAVVAIYTYGLRSAEAIFLSVFVASATEAFGSLIFKHMKPSRLVDLSTVFTGLAIALAVPSSAPLWFAPVGSFFAIAIAKLPFGNTNSAPFVPAAVGISFLTLSYPDKMFSYPSLSIGSLSATVGDPDFIPGVSLAQMLSQSKSIGTSIVNVLDVLVGRVPGPMGASCLILMLGTLVYMIIRKHPGVMTTGAFLAACSVMSVLFPRVLIGRSYSLLMELSAGLLFYAAVFFISDPFTSPKSQLGRVLYGASAGVLTMLFRYFGVYEDGVCFVIIIMNALSAQFDNWGVSLDTKIQKKNASRPEKRAKMLKPEPEPETLPMPETPSEGGILSNE